MADQSELKREKKLADLEKRTAALEQAVFGKKAKPVEKTTRGGSQLATDTIMEEPKHGQEN